MTRENKLALVIGFGLMLFVGILVSDHFSAQRFDPATVVQSGEPESLDPVRLDEVGSETLAPVAPVGDAGPVELASNGLVLFTSAAVCRLIDAFQSAAASLAGSRPSVSRIIELVSGDTFFAPSASATGLGSGRGFQYSSLSRTVASTTGISTHSALASISASGGASKGGTRLPSLNGSFDFGSTGFSGAGDVAPVPPSTVSFSAGLSVAPSPSAGDVALFSTSFLSGCPPGPQPTTMSNASSTAKWTPPSNADKIDPRRGSFGPTRRLFRGETREIRRAIDEVLAVGNLGHRTQPLRAGSITFPKTRRPRFGPRAGQVALDGRGGLA